jgi:serine/threonine protein kinase
VSRPPQIPGYQYVADIATGGYSVVYRYRQRSPRRDVAVKVLTAFEGGDTGHGGPEQRDAEADMMATLGNHPNIVQVIVADVAPDGRHYIIMPYYAGASLAELAAQGPLAVGKVLRVGVQIAGALDAAHRVGLLHRDIKPANVLLDEYGTPRLTDFGIAGWVGPQQRAVAEGMSLPWSPPEVVAGGESRRASDVYALGATLFHLLTGSPPHARPGDTREALERRVQDEDAPPTGRADVPPALERLLARMLCRTPSGRPDSASLVAAELREIEDARGGPAPADAPWHSGAAVDELPPRFVATERRDRPLFAPPAVVEPDKEKPARVEPDYSRTQRREDDAEDHHSDTIPAIGGPVDRRTRMSQWVLIGAATVAVAVLSVGIVLAAKGSPPARPTTPIGVGSSQDAALDELPPGAVAITAERHGGKLTFKWSYDGQLAGDTFLWRVRGRAAETSATAAVVSIPDPPGTQLCIQVKVVRNDGNGSPDWSPEGCGS